MSFGRDCRRRAACADRAHLRPCCATLVSRTWEGPARAGPSRPTELRVRSYSESDPLVLSEPRPPIVPSDGVTPSPPVVCSGAVSDAPAWAVLPVRLVPVRAREVVLREL